MALGPGVENRTQIDPGPVGPFCIEGEASAGGDQTGQDHGVQGEGIFANRWKGDGEDGEFRRFLRLIRG